MKVKLLDIIIFICIILLLVSAASFLFSPYYSVTMENKGDVDKNKNPNTWEVIEYNNLSEEEKKLITIKSVDSYEKYKINTNNVNEYNIRSELKNSYVIINGDIYEVIISHSSTFRSRMLLFNLTITLILIFYRFKKYSNINLKENDENMFIILILYTIALLIILPIFTDYIYLF